MNTDFEVNVTFCFVLRIHSKYIRRTGILLTVIVENTRSKFYKLAERIRLRLIFMNLEFIASVLSNPRIRINQVCKKLKVGFFILTDADRIW